MNIKLIALFLFSILLSSQNAQSQTVISEDETCTISTRRINKRYVDSFKDSLKLTIMVYKVMVGRKSYDVDFWYSEYIKEESPLLAVNEDLAMRVSIARVTSNGKKCYLYKVHLFEKQLDCWSERNVATRWNHFRLGRIHGGYHLGRKSTKSCFGYQGNVDVR